MRRMAKFLVTAAALAAACGPWRAEARGLCTPVASANGAVLGAVDALGQTCVTGAFGRGVHRRGRLIVVNGNLVAVGNGRVLRRVAVVRPVVVAGTPGLVAVPTFIVPNFPVVTVTPGTLAFVTTTASPFAVTTFSTPGAFTTGSLGPFTTFSNSQVALRSVAVPLGTTVTTRVVGTGRGVRLGGHR
jgi:hypothetical protein